MYKISIVPDTNVLMSNLDVINTIFQYEFPLIYTLNISRTVLKELDSLKNKKPEARAAIKFIQSIACSLKTEIEGHIDERKMELDIAGNTTIEETNNDDKILNYIFKLENPIFLTNDVALLLKSHSFNIKTIQIGNDRADIVILKILESFGLDNPHYNASIIDSGLKSDDTHVNEQLKHIEQYNPALNQQVRPYSSNELERLSQIDKAYQQARAMAFENIKVNMKNIIEPIIHQILYKELGESYVILLREPLDLEFYLGLVVKNFFLFKSYLPKSSQNIICTFLKNIRLAKYEDLIAPAETICHIFQNISGTR